MLIYYYKFSHYILDKFKSGPNQNQEFHVTVKKMAYLGELDQNLLSAVGGLQYGRIMSPILMESCVNSVLFLINIKLNMKSIIQ